MSFYITLPSNSSTEEFPNNRQSDYTTLINPPLIINSTSEVALVDITYAPQISVKVGSITFDNPFYYQDTSPRYELEPWLLRDKYVTADIKIQNGIDAASFVKLLNFEIEKAALLVEYSNLYEYTFMPNYRHLNQCRIYLQSEKEKHFASEGKKYLPRVCAVRVQNKYFIIVPDNKDEFYQNVIVTSGLGFYNSERNRYEVKVANLRELEKQLFVELLYFVPNEKITPEIAKYYMDLHGSIDGFALIDGISDFISRTKNYRTNWGLPVFVYEKNLLSVNYSGPMRKPKLSGILKEVINLESVTLNSDIIIMPHLNVKYYAAVYCDFIEDQYVGDAHGPIIRLINLNSNNPSEIVSVYENPHYVKCKKTVINSINIKILDLEGNPILFENKFGFVILKLHIRERNDY